MSIWITGDIHGNLCERFSKRRFPQQKDNEIFPEDKSSVMIICGDFGCIWDFRGENEEEKNKLDWLENKPWTTVFVCGNHENFKRLMEYPIKKWNGGLVHEIRPHVLHLMRGEVYSIHEKKFFAFGGASSHDIKDGILDRDKFEDNDVFKRTYKKWYQEGKMFRVKNISWWEEELPSDEEMLNGKLNLQKHHNRVDYIITHSPSAWTLSQLGLGCYKQDMLTRYLEDIKSIINFKKHYCGHMHVDVCVNDKDIILYRNIERIE